MYNESIQDSVSLILLLFSRCIGLFLCSPFFAGKAIPKSVRLGLAAACSLLIAPPLSAHLHFSVPYSGFMLQILKEFVIGYLIGFCFALLFEAAAFAGQMIGVLTGLSATELLDPIASSSHPLLGRFYLLLACAIFFTLDLHHSLLRLLYASFDPLTVPTYPIGNTTVFSVIKMSSTLFQYALELAVLPLVILLSLIGCFGILSRFFPIFWIGFPLQLLIGLTAIGFSIRFFAPFLERAFFQFREIILKSL